MEEQNNWFHKVMTFLARAGEFLKSAGKAIYQVILRRTWQFLLWYKRLWVKTTHNKYDEFVYKRGVGMAAATAVFVILIPTLVMLALQTCYYLATYKADSIYLIQSEEIYPDDNTWAVRGCYNQTCDSDSSLYFRIRPSLFHHLWSFSHGGGVFLPDIVGSSVPTGLTKCNIKSYGLRLKILMTFDIYPTILDIQCEDYGIHGVKEKE